MVLDHSGSFVSEDAAAEEIDRNEVEPLEWHADPRGTARCLGADWRPVRLEYHAIDHSFASGQALCTWIVDCIVEMHQPVIVLIYAGAHWVVVDGVRWQQEDGERVLVGVYVVDPYPHEPSRLFVPAAVFLRKYAEANEFGSIWLSRFVGVGPTVMRPFPFKEDVRIRSFSYSRLPNSSALLKLIGYRVLYEQTISQMNLLGFEELRRPMGGGGPRRPVFVIGVGVSNFALVPFDLSDQPETEGSLWAAVEIETGSILEVTDDISANLELYERNMEAPDAALDRDMVVSEDVFWAPTALTWSRFSVFRRVQVAGREAFLFSNGRLELNLPLRDKGGG
ncbi:hypothetical protein OICFNHDK_2796 [Methylobacterium bullatum]|uniref:Uncharacterized protein n=2 Tax=Methylobacterium bullatum TaxID=570505 RepID=A0AAV4Z9B9_9HYPH|nr:hypothetical protein OICFNHDK_2796 [Methylobacterium bullatum]